MVGIHLDWENLKPILEGILMDDYILAVLRYSCKVLIDVMSSRVYLNGGKKG